MSLSGKRFQFDKLYESNEGGDARRFGGIDLFQAGDVSFIRPGRGPVSMGMRFRPIPSGATRSAM